SLLHDFGKIGVREKVLLKSKKLYPSEEQIVMDRFRIIRQSIELHYTRKQLEFFQTKTREEALAYFAETHSEMEDQLKELDEFLKFIIRCNEPTVLSQGGFEKLEEIHKKYFYSMFNMPRSYLTAEETASLSVPKGSLNPQDRKEIESHVTHTYKFLSIIPWTKNLSNVPDIAHAHHEKLDGSGYPLRLKSEQIPIQSKMMTIADIYDALTALDRPYKKAVPVDRALDILGYEAKDHHIDQRLLDVFIESKLYQLVTRFRLSGKRLEQK
ncbi:MAG: phosphodiesterase, partial [SAR324 cluster bacterium]|nr:phosphodiesterase [SAR324 cluster bacterium]